MSRTIASVAVLCVVAFIQGSDANYRRGYGQQHQEEEKLKIDPYKVLGLSEDATPSQIKKAYRVLSLKYHPDKNKSPDAKEKMQEVSQAYEMVGDPDQKMIFDEFGNSEKFYNKWQYDMNQKKNGKKASKKDFYTHSDDVKNLNKRNFYGFLGEKGPAMVEFYAPWCVHCQDMVGEYKKLGVLLDEKARLGAVNCENNQNVCNQQGIQSYPSLRLYIPQEGGNGMDMEEYHGEHTAEAMYSFVEVAMSDDLVSLTTESFDKKVAGTDDIWIIDFSAGAWCGPCTSLKRYMRQYASTLKGKTHVGIVNCDNEADLCGRMGVEYFPQLRLFKRGSTEATGRLLESKSHFPAANTLDLFSTLVDIFVPDKPEAEELVDDSHLDEVEDDPEHDEL